MKGPLDDELDAGGTISSLPHPKVLKNSKIEQIERRMLYGKGRGKAPVKTKREEPKLLPF
jgi:hypothetical protein